MTRTSACRPGAFVAVAEVGHLYEAELMALRLRDAGIEAELVDQSFRQEPLPSVRALALVTVLVPSERHDEARKLLAQRSDLPEDAEEEASFSADREAGEE